MTALFLGVLLSLSASAGEEFHNLSFTGDGKTPNALQLMEAQTRGLAESRSLADTDRRGAATYSIPVPMPPALFGPAVSLTYSSNGGEGPLARGWSIETGPSIRRITDREGDVAYGEYDEAYRLTGGPSALLLPRDGWTGDGPREFAMLTDDGAVGRAFRGGKGWVVVANGVTTTFRSGHAAGTAREGAVVDEWVVDQMVDTRGNHIWFEYESVPHSYPFTNHNGGPSPRGMAGLESTKARGFHEPPGDRTGALATLATDAGDRRRCQPG